WTLERAGRSTVTSTEPGLPNRPRPRCLGVFTSSRPSAYSTRVWSAARLPARCPRRGLVGGADVRVGARVAGADLDDRVGAVGGDDPQVADDQLDGRRAREWQVVRR